MSKNIKHHIFFLYFYGEMIKIVYTILVIIIKILEIHFDTSNLSLEKNIIRFELLAQKEKTNKLIAIILYNKY